MGELGEAVQVRGGEHAGFVDDECRASGELPFGAWSLGTGPLVEQLGDRIGAHAGLAFQHLRRFGSGSNTEHLAAVSFKVGHGCTKHGGLAGTGGADDHDERIMSSDGGRCLGLQQVESITLDGPRRLRLVELGVDRPGKDRFLLGDHLVAGDVGRGRLDPQRPTI